MRKRIYNFRTAITLVESLIVLFVIGMLIALSAMAVQRVRNSAAQADCANRLRHLALAVNLFEGVNRKLPEGCGYPYLKSPSDLLSQGGVSWQTAILPFMDQGPLAQKVTEAHRLDPSTVRHPFHILARETSLPNLLCPTERLSIGENMAASWRWGISSYMGVAGTDKYLNDGIFHKNLQVRIAHITDGTSNTLLIGERPAGPDGIHAAWYASWGDSVCWFSQILHAGNGRWHPYFSSCQVSISVFRPGKLDEFCDLNHFWRLHSGGANFAFADGSVRFLSYSSASIIPALATRAGGESVSFD